MKHEYAIRCYKNGSRKFSCNLTKSEAKAFRIAAKHLIQYLNKNYKLGMSKRDGRLSSEELRAFTCSCTRDI